MMTRTLRILIMRYVPCQVPFSLLHSGPEPETFVVLERDDRVHELHLNTARIPTNSPLGWRRLDIYSG